MKAGLLLGLVQNAALLLALAFLFDTTIMRWKPGKTSWRQVPVGLGAGLIAILVMLTPWTFSPGIIFDTRSVLLGVSGLFLGTVPTIIAMAMAIALRIFQGGSGALTGISVILASGLIGIAWRHWRKRRLIGMGWLELYLLGIVIHVVMLALMLTLPWERAMQVLAAISTPVMLVYPIGTALLGMLMVNSLKRERTAEELARSGARLTSLLNIQQYKADTTQGFLDYALEEAIKLTGSKLGYIYHYHEDRRQFVLNTWSKDVMKECTVLEPQTCYELDKTGVWGEAVRQGKPIVLNDFQASHPLKKGYPEGHAHLYRYLTIPVFSGGRIVAVAAVANKETDYDEGDVQQLILLMEAVWKEVERRQAQQALQESEDRFLVAFQNSPVAMVLIRAADHTLIEVNKVFLHDTGFSPEEVIGHTALELNLFVDKSVQEESLERLNRDGSFYGMEMRFRMKDGTIRTSLVSSSVMNIHGQPHYFSSILDITERKQAEEKVRAARAQAELALQSTTRSRQALLSMVEDLKRSAETLRESEERFRVLYEQAGLGISIVSPEGRFVRANPKFCEMLGYSEEELQQMDFQTITHPDDLDLDLVPYTRLLAGEIDVMNIEKRYLRRDGKPVWTHLNVSLVHDSAGKPTFAIGISEDITQRRRDEEMLKRHRNELKKRAEQLALLNRLDRVIVSSLHLEQVLDGFISEMAGLVKLDRVSVVLFDEKGKNWHVVRLWTRGKPVIVPGVWYAVKGSVLERIAQTREPFVENVLGEKGNTSDVEALQREGVRSRIVVPLIRHGKVIGVLAQACYTPVKYTRDNVSFMQSLADLMVIAIENAKLYEQVQNYTTELEERVAERTRLLESANRELEAFAYSISHDLRAPLRAMDGFSNALLAEYSQHFDERGRHYLERIQASSQRMGQLINDLLDLSRVSRGELHVQEVDLSALARMVAATLQEQDPNRQVEWVIADDLSAIMDPRLVQIAFENLLGNAWKFTGTRKQARIEVGVTELNGERTFFVRDNGVGFDMAYAGKLFAPFQRLHGMAEFPGTGIGLATVQRIIHRHGGRIWPEAKVGEGATFYFTPGGTLAK